MRLIKLLYFLIIVVKYIVVVSPEKNKALQKTQISLRGVEKLSFQNSDSKQGKIQNWRLHFSKKFILNRLNAH